LARERLLLPGFFLPDAPVPHRRPAAPGRAEPRDVVDLRRLKAAQPELAPAIDLELALLGLTRRVQARVPLPPTLTERASAASALAEGRAILRFGDLPIDWSDFRLMLREVCDLLRRADLIPADAATAAMRLAREGHTLEPVVAAYFEATVERRDPAPGVEPLAQVFALALRPFLARCAEALLPRMDLAVWQRGFCPLCAADPDFSVYTAASQRQLVCSRCQARWPYPEHRCPFCGNANEHHLTSFSGRDRCYRIDACESCRRYVKAYDERNADRPLLLAVDSVATLLLDAAASQRGYS
jgi:formate dehydrogenase maturation protein FdhE